MPKELLEERTAVTNEEIKNLLAAEGDCVSILVPIEKVPGQTNKNSVRLRQAISEAERRLTERGRSSDEVKELMAPIREFGEDRERIGNTSGSLILLRSRSLFRDFHIGCPVSEHVVVGDHFEIRPLLKEVEASRPFYVLALARKAIRLLRCTDHSSEVLDLPAGTPTDFYGWAQTDKPDHDLTNSTTSGPSSGTSKGVMFTTSSDREDHDEYWHHFYTAVDKGVNEVLKADPGSPLVLVGVEKELAIYHKVTKYDNVVPGGVHGAPDSLKGGEMHKRALEHLRAQLDPTLEKALQLYEKSVSQARTSHQVNQCVKAAYEGRVAYLFLAENAAQMGSFDAATQRAQQHSSTQPGDEDLLNAAAAETIMHGGEVFIVRPDMVPNNSVIAAVLRF